MYWVIFFIVIALMGLCVCILADLETKKNITLAITLVILSFTITKLFSSAAERQQKCKQLFSQELEFKLKGDNTSAKIIEDTRSQIFC